MKEIIQEVIASGIYNLSDLLKKIDTLWLQASITDEERQALIQAAQENANPEYGYAGFQEQLNTILDRVDALEQETKILRAAIEALGGTVGEPEPGEEWPAWYPWDGVGRSPWQKGSQCTHKEKKWVSQVDDNIWEPGAVGVYETIWKEEASA
ncbi:hypothetical protein [Pseudoflavonifractor sp. An85]|uniref:hypothetical protein n=1 Tax=Pseudoflavonifractor sp. An85 TaxID=1965661 RepID=UPI000B3AF339|nr:hypothetical protein [Pseudoflavonifractor sp. An85]OUN15093.1 hypothetical protein B5G37_14820 [Pseudoflavonifractor sp. An85]